MSTHFYVQMDSLKEIEAALGMARDKSRLILKAAINNTAKQTNRSMVKGTKRKYSYKRGAGSEDSVTNTVGDMKAANKVKKAKSGDLSASVEVKGPINELLGFHVAPALYVPGGGYPEWYKARVLKKGRTQKIALRPNAGGDKYKAFIIQYKSGHYALAQRIPGQRMEKDPRKEAVKSLLSISTPKAEETVYKEEIDPDMYDILQRNIREQIQKFLK